MNKISSLAFNVINILCVVLLAIIMTIALNGEIIALPVLSVISATIICVVLFINKQKSQRKVRAKKLLTRLRNFAKNHTTGLKVAVGIALFLSLIARFLPVILNVTYTLDGGLTDTGVHYYAAQQLADDWLADYILEYEKTYPYLYGYSLTLSYFCRALFGNINLAIIVSNLLFDLIGAVLFYKLLKRLFSRETAMVGTFLYLINPLSIVLCWLPLNLVLVNTLLVLALYLAVLLLDKIKQNSILPSLCLAVLLGLVIFVSNLYRPIFTIILIAVIICIVLYMLKTLASQTRVSATNSTNIKKLKKSNNKRETSDLLFKIIITPILMLLLLILSFGLSTTFTNRFVESRFGEDLLGASGGWSFYVGSNYDTKGAWSRSDSGHFFNEVVQQNEKITDAHEQIKQEGIARYLALNPLQLFNHLANKLDVLFGDSGNTIYDISYTFNIYSNGTLYKFLASLVSIYFLFIVLGALIFVWCTRYNSNPKILLLKLSLLGLTAGFLLVEVMARYAFVMHPILICCTSAAIYAFGVQKKDKQKILIPND